MDIQILSNHQSPSLGGTLLRFPNTERPFQAHHISLPGAILSPRATHCHRSRRAWGRDVGAPYAVAQSFKDHWARKGAQGQHHFCSCSEKCLHILRVSSFTEQHSRSLWSRTGTMNPSWQEQLPGHPLEALYHFSWSRGSPSPGAVHSTAHGGTAQLLLFCSAYLHHSGR